MLRRLGVPVLLVALALGLGAVPAASAAPASDVGARAAAARCPDESLSDRAAVRTEAGARLGTARMYVTPRDDEFVFCIRVTPVEHLRSRDVSAFVRHRRVAADGGRWPSVTIKMSWRRPFVVYGSFEPGSGIAALVTIKTPDGTRGTARVRATVS
ncbi:hypothetical protein L2K70_18705 [Nocardioides KLBMP 9356]|uniref:Uncharacterized protein n=1 Tax=Nocardioides potassii TaxID=2911371 RepID=A0ABS9HGY3_9ACTN|nr:hypothetical protein [Nocardioides potassii]MCF6379647.1 hypothetical protein [Nocardioides potassii]